MRNREYLTLCVNHALDQTYVELLKFHRKTHVSQLFVKLIYNSCALRKHWSTMITEVQCVYTADIEFTRFRFKHLSCNSSVCTI